MTRRDPAERFWAMVDIRNPDECWPWLGSINHKGYGQFWDGERHVSAHRFSAGITDQKLVGDHVCHNLSGCTAAGNCVHRRCVNPSHIEAVTQSVNVKRGQTGRTRTPWKTVCVRGHQYTPENQYIDGKGYQRCKQCRRITWREWKARQ